MKQYQKQTHNFEMDERKKFEEEGYVSKGASLRKGQAGGSAVLLAELAESKVAMRVKAKEIGRVTGLNRMKLDQTRSKREEKALAALLSTEGLTEEDAVQTIGQAMGYEGGAEGPMRTAILLYKLNSRAKEPNAPNARLQTLLQHVEGRFGAVMEGHPFITQLNRYGFAIGRIAELNGFGSRDRFKIARTIVLFGVNRPDQDNVMAVLRKSGHQNLLGIQKFNHIRNVLTVDSADAEQQMGAMLTWKTEKGDDDEAKVVEGRYKPISFYCQPTFAGPCSTVVNLLMGHVPLPSHRGEYLSILCRLNEIGRTHFFGSGDNVSVFIRLSKCNEVFIANEESRDPFALKVHLQRFVGKVDPEEEDKQKVFREVMYKMCLKYFLEFSRPIQRVTKSVTRNGRTGQLKVAMVPQLFFDTILRDEYYLKNYEEMVEQMFDMDDEEGLAELKPEYHGAKFAKSTAAAGFPYQTNRQNAMEDLQKYNKEIIDCINDDDSQETVLKKYPPMIQNQMKPKQEVFPLKTPLIPLRGKKEYSDSDIDLICGKNGYVEKGRFIWVPNSWLLIQTITFMSLISKCNRKNVFNEHAMMIRGYARETTGEDEQVPPNPHLDGVKVADLINLSKLVTTDGGFDLVVRYLNFERPYKPKGAENYRALVYSDNVYLSGILSDSISCDNIILAPGAPRHNYKERKGRYSGVVPRGTKVILSMDGAKMETSANEDFVDSLISAYCDAYGFPEILSTLFTKYIKFTVAGGQSVYGNFVFKQMHQGSGSGFTAEANFALSWICFVTYSEMQRARDGDLTRFDMHGFFKLCKKVGVTYTLERCVVVREFGKPLVYSGDICEIDFLGMGAVRIRTHSPFGDDYSYGPGLEEDRFDKALLFSKRDMKRMNQMKIQGILASKAVSLAMGGGVRDPAMCRILATMVLEGQHVFFNGGDELISAMVEEETDDLLLGLGKGISLKLVDCLQTASTRYMGDVDTVRIVTHIAETLTLLYTGLFSHKNSMETESSLESVDPARPLSTSGTLDEDEVGRVRAGKEELEESYNLRGEVADQESKQGMNEKFSELLKKFLETDKIVGHKSFVTKEKFHVVTVEKESMDRMVDIMSKGELYGEGLRSELKKYIIRFIKRNKHIYCTKFEGQREKIEKADNFVRKVNKQNQEFGEKIDKESRTLTAKTEYGVDVSLDAIKEPYVSMKVRFIGSESHGNITNFQSYITTRKLDTYLVDYKRRVRQICDVLERRGMRALIDLFDQSSIVKVAEMNANQECVQRFTIKMADDTEKVLLPAEYFLSSENLDVEEGEGVLRGEKYYKTVKHPTSVFSSKLRKGKLIYYRLTEMSLKVIEALIRLKDKFEEEGSKEKAKFLLGLLFATAFGAACRDYRPLVDISPPDSEEKEIISLDGAYITLSQVVKAACGKDPHPEEKERK